MAFVFTKSLNIYKYGKINILSEVKLQIIPFFPVAIIGININHEKTTDKRAISDHVNLPSIAISQIQGITAPIKKTAENINDKIRFFFVIIYFSSCKFYSISINNYYTAYSVICQQ